MKVITDDLWFPEGPVCLPDGNLLVVEIRRGTLTHIRPDGRKTIVARLGGGPNGAALGPDGRVYVCNNGGFEWKQRGGHIEPVGTPADYTSGRIERVDLATGQFEVLYDTDGARPLRGPNDIVFDAHGGFWFTDLGKNRGRQFDWGAVCYAKADGSSVREVLFPMWQPNGVGLSPDGKTLYVAESATCRLWAWPVTAPGEVARTGEATVPHRGRLVFSSSTWRRYDSLAVEAGGNICIGTLDHGGISVCRPEGGELEFFAMPGHHATNICFGGADMRKAWITSSYAGQLIEVDWPRLGLRLN
jgi:gluconolactonase